MQNWLQPPQTTLANGSVVWPAPILFGAVAPISFGGDFNGTAGTPHYDPSVAMTPDGNMVVTYAEQETRKQPSLR